MATVVSIAADRARRSAKAVDFSGRSWRRMLVGSSVAIGFVIAVGVGSLAFLSKFEAQFYQPLVLIVALVSVIGLTKVLLANLVFLALLHDEPSQSPAPASSAPERARLAPRPPVRLGATRPGPARSSRRRPNR